MSTSNHDEDRVSEIQVLRILPEPALGRRSLLGSAMSLTSMMLLPLPLAPAAKGAQAEAGGVLPAQLRAVLEAFTDRIIPADDDGPGALAAGAAGYVDRTLADWNAGEAVFLAEGLKAIDTFARQRFDAGFTALSDGERDSVLMAMEAGDAEGFENSQAVFNRLYRLTLEGTFSDPYHGGNRDYVGWNLIGYPGAVMASTPDMQRMGRRLPPLHTSAYGADYDGD